MVHLSFISYGLATIFTRMQLPTDLRINISLVGASRRGNSMFVFRYQKSRSESTFEKNQDCSKGFSTVVPDRKFFAWVAGS